IRSLRNQYRPAAGPATFRPISWLRSDPSLVTPAMSTRCNVRSLHLRKFLAIPVFFPETGRFPRKTGRRLSTNGQSLRGIRDLDDFSKSKITERKQGDDSLETGGIRCSRFLPGSDH